MDGTIVVGLDASPGSLDAMQWAVGTAARTGATVQPVSAWEYPIVALLPFPAGLPAPPPEVLQEEAEARARRLVDRDEIWQNVETRDRVSLADPIVKQGATGKLLCAAAKPDDILVLGSRGLGSVKRVMLGSVTSYCARAATGPVVVVPTPAGDSQDKGVVVVGIDGSESSNQAINWADKWAAEDALLLIVHAWDLPPTLDATLAEIDVGLIEAGADELLADAAKRVTRHKVDTLRLRGDARTELERLAQDADALVVGARGRSKLERMLLGSVATYSVQHAQVPTVVVHATEESADS
ncbi:MAG: universal stress protein [Acidimicrobiales bacterium]